MPAVPEGDPWLNSEQAAGLWGVKVTTFRSYVHRGYAPVPDDPGDLSMPAIARRPRWHKSQIIAAKGCKHLDTARMRVDDDVYIQCKVCRQAYRRPERIRGRGSNGDPHPEIRL